MKHEIINLPLKVPENRIKGYLYTKLEDFEVCEITDNTRYDTKAYNSIVTTGIEKKIPCYLKFTLVKKGISTFEAIDRLSKGLQISPYQIQHNGLKDTFGVTTQQISIYCNNMFILNKLKKIRFKRFFLKNLKISQKKCKIGSHWGNHFRIIVRKPNYDTSSLESIHTTIRIPNYYDNQRFGIRQNNHKIGKLIILGKYEQALKKFCIDFNNETQNKIILRKKIKRAWKNWKKCYGLVKNELDFIDEKKFFAYLIDNPNDFLGALKQTSLCKFFLHSYHSFLFNKALTTLLKPNNSCSISTIPSLGHDTKFSNRLVKKIYNVIMKKEKIKLSSFKIKDDSSLSLNGNNRNIFFEISNFSYKTDEDKNLILEFNIPKGSYASLFLDYIIDNLSKNKKLC